MLFLKKLMQLLQPMEFRNLNSESAPTITFSTIILNSKYSFKDAQNTRCNEVQIMRINASVLSIKITLKIMQTFMIKPSLFSIFQPKNHKEKFQKTMMKTKGKKAPRLNKRKSKTQRKIRRLIISKTKMIQKST